MNILRKLAITEVTNVKNILVKDQVNELPKRSITEKVDKIGLGTGTFPTTANAVVQLAIYREEHWSRWQQVQDQTEIMQPRC